MPKCEHDTINRSTGRCTDCGEQIIKKEINTADDLVEEIANRVVGKLTPSKDKKDKKDDKPENLLEKFLGGSKK